MLFRNTCLSLFEKDKLLFSFMMAMRVRYEDGVNPNEWRFLLTGISGMSDDLSQAKDSNPLPSIIEPQMWANVCELAHLPGFEILPTEISDDPVQWDSFIVSATMNALEVEGFEQVQTMLPAPFNNPEKYTYLQVLLLIRAVKMEILIPAFRSFVKSSIGEDYIYAPLFDLQKAYNESTTETPLIFVLSPGNDSLPLKNSLKRVSERSTRYHSGKTRGNELLALSE
jgi:dynein heavy chain